MRTDVKVWLICAFVIVLGVIIFFVVQGNSHQVRADNTPRVPAPTTGSPARTADPTPTPAAPLADRALVAGPVGGGSIIPPAPSIGSGTTTNPAGPTTIPGVAPAATSPAVIRYPGASDPLIPSPRPTMEFGSTSSVGTPTATTGTTYKIQKGDMLGTIAKKYGVTVKALETANPGINPNNLKVDSTLKIPAAAPATPAVAGAATPAHTPATPAVTTTVLSLTPKAGATYKVKKGDTLTTIAKTAYGNGAKATIQKILQANRSINDPDVVSVGVELKIP